MPTTCVPPSVTEAKEIHLATLLAGYHQVLVAFSGGVDSTYLLARAHAVLGDRAVAVTADSPSLPRQQLATARAFCRDHGIRHVVVETAEFQDPAFLANDGQRCGRCKTALMQAMDALARSGESAAVTLLGAIADDHNDHRPGMRAAAAAGARMPLAECGFTKAEVRERSRAHGLPTWDRPATPCLASRIPYGEPVDAQVLRMVEAAELLLHALAFPECRARHHRIGNGRGHLCRIEVPVHDLPRLVALRERLVSRLGTIGYTSVCVDLAGFASGGLNRLLTDTERR